MPKTEVGHQQPTQPAAVALTPTEGELDDVAAARVRHYADQAHAANTRRAYTADWEAFTNWCALVNRTALPAVPDTVASYLATAADTVTVDGQPAYAVATLSRWVAAINAAHTAAGHDRPSEAAVVRNTLRGIKAARQERQRRRTPLLLEGLQATLDVMETATWPSVVASCRDASLLVIGWAAALRRSELAELRAEDVTLHPQDGLHLYLRSSKSDQEARGTVRAVPYGRDRRTCAPCQWLRWIQLVALADADANRSQLMRQALQAPADNASHWCRGSDPPEVTGPLLRSVTRWGQIRDNAMRPEAVNDAIKRRIGAAGLVGDYGAHSLRAGFVTEAFRAGSEARAIARQTGHAHISTLLIYDREADPLRGSAVTDLAL